MNQLKVHPQHSIIAAHEQGWSRQRIAPELALDRAAVCKYLATTEAKPATPHTGSGSASGQTSLCGPLREQIASAWQAGLSVQQIHQDLVVEHQSAGSYHAVQNRPFAGWSVSQTRSCRWILAGGTGGGELEPTPDAFVSRYPEPFAQGLLRDDVAADDGEFCPLPEESVGHFSDVTALEVIDNLKAGVLQADWFDPKLNPKPKEFARFPAVQRFSLWQACRGASLGEMAENDLTD